MLCIGPEKYFTRDIIERVCIAKKKWKRRASGAIFIPSIDWAVVDSRGITAELRECSLIHFRFGCAAKSKTKWSRDAKNKPQSGVNGDFHKSPRRE